MVVPAVEFDRPAREPVWGTSVLPWRVGDVVLSLWVAVAMGYKKVVLWCQVSKRGEQYYGGGLAGQVRHLRAVAESYGLEVIGVFTVTDAGWKTRRHPKFQEAVRLARADGAFLLAEAADRYLRHRGYIAQDGDKNPLPTREQWERLADAADGVPLATLLHPDATWEQMHRCHSRRGMEQAGNSGGAPVKKKHGYKMVRRERKLPELIRLHVAEGALLREAAKQVGVGLRTAERRVAWYKQGRWPELEGQMQHHRRGAGAATAGWGRG